MDASTSTDDLKTPPLYLVLYPHRLGILSSRKPTVSSQPPSEVEEPLNMRPLFPYWTYWQTSDDYNTVTSTHTSERNSRSDNLSSIFSPDRIQNSTWTKYKGGDDNTMSSKHYHTLNKYNPILSQDFLKNKNAYSHYNAKSCMSELSNNYLQKKSVISAGLNSSGSSLFSLNPNRIPFHLPPIELNVKKLEEITNIRPIHEQEQTKHLLPPIERLNAGTIERNEQPGYKTKLQHIDRKSSGIRKKKKGRARKSLIGLLQRNVRGQTENQPTAQEVRNTISESGSTPKPTYNRWCPSSSGSTLKEANFTPQHTMPRKATMVDALSQNPDASKGLLNRRYSLPEIIMRKYHIRQHSAEVECSEVRSAPSRSISPAFSSGSSRCRKDREAFRKSALLRRMFGNDGMDTSSSCGDCSRYTSNKDIVRFESSQRETRSLDGSRGELIGRRCQGQTPSRLSFGCDCQTPCSINTKPPLPGWGTPKRQRINSPCRKSDGMLRIAMKNSYDRSEENTRSRKESVSSFNTYPNYSETFANDNQLRKDIPQNEKIPNITSHIEKTVEPLKKNSESNIAYSANDQCDNNQNNLSQLAELPLGNEEVKIIPFENTKMQPHCELLEIVVSETVNCITEKAFLDNKLSSKSIYSKPHDVNGKVELDQYVSNILVESLNNLNQQLEEMNASMNSDRRFSIVEKEIKVKLQNTGINTIVHLSPDSNNTIIFGNKEICDEDRNTDNIDNFVRFDLEKVDTQMSNNNFTNSSSSATQISYDSALKRDLDNNVLNNSATEQNNAVNHLDHINTTVMKQIQKLFDDANMNYSGISHIEIENVGILIEENLDKKEYDENQNSSGREAKPVGEICAKNSKKPISVQIHAPRHTSPSFLESMEVHLSSDADNMASDNNSLVDSLDDPTSPRMYLRRKSDNLARSGVSVVNVFPTPPNDILESPKEKSETFFVRLREDSCNCEKENVIVAEHMPDTIKEKLIQRHKKRLLRLEHLKKKKIRTAKREIEKQRRAEIIKAKKEVEEECKAIFGSIIDEIILNMALEEQKYAKLKEKMSSSKVTKNEIKRNFKPKSKNNLSSTSSLNDMDSFKINKRGEIQFAEPKHNDDIKNKKRNSFSSPNESLKSDLQSQEEQPKRIYQKSEIHDGKKRIEILEILEYIDVSTDTSNSDESLNGNKYKSKIPIPLNENVHKIPRIKGTLRNNISPKRSNEKNSQSLEMLDSLEISSPTLPQRNRRESVPQIQQRSRNNSSKRSFQPFDKIPEEPCSEKVKVKTDDAKTQTVEKITYDKTTSPVSNDHYLNNKIYQKKMFSAITSPIFTPTRKPFQNSTACSPVGESMLNNKPKNIWKGFQKDNRTNYNKGNPKNIESKTNDYNDKYKCLSNTPRLQSGELYQKKDKVKTFSNKIIPDRITKHKVETKILKSGNVDLRKELASQTRGEYIERKNNEKQSEKSDSPKKTISDLKSEIFTSSSDTDSGGSLLCSLAPKWLQMGHLAKTKRQYRKKVVQTQQRSHKPTGGWSVTVAGNSFTALPSDVQMRLTFPNPPSLSDSGFAEESWKSKENTGFLPPAQQSKSVEVVMQKNSTDSTLKTTVKKEREPLPEVETSFKKQQSKSKNSVKTRRHSSQPSWLQEDVIPPLRGNSDDLSVTGSMIVPERKPRVPTMSERDLTRTNRHSKNL